MQIPIGRCLIHGGILGSRVASGALPPGLTARANPPAEQVDLTGRNGTRCGTFR
jgi:hypothetical protein